MTDQAERLFNCCPHGVAPDWSQYVALQIGGCRDDDGATDGGLTYQTAEFFTVYGVVMDGDLRMVEAITDVPTVSLINALSVAQELAAISGLRLTVCPFLFA